MAVYFGYHSNDHDWIVSVDDRSLSPRHDLRRYADHLNWRDPYGALQLALAILAHHCGKDQRRAMVLHRRFSRQVVSHLPTIWMLDSMEVEATLIAIELDPKPAIPGSGELSGFAFDC